MWRGSRRGMPGPFEKFFLQKLVRCAARSTGEVAWPPRTFGHCAAAFARRWRRGPLVWFGVLFQFCVFQGGEAQRFAGLEGLLEVFAEN